MRPLVAREKIAELVAEHCDAARFQPDNRHARLYLQGKRVEDVQQQVFGAVQHPEVVEGASATQIPLGKLHTEPGVLENVNRSLGRIRKEVVVERIRPENDDWSIGVERTVAPKPILERLRREGWDRSLPRNSRDHLGDISQER